MRYTNENIIQEFETLRNQESEIRELANRKFLTLAERNALEFELEFVSEEIGSLRSEYLAAVEAGR